MGNFQTGKQRKELNFLPWMIECLMFASSEIFATHEKKARAIKTLKKKPQRIIILVFERVGVWARAAK